jgi:hypothetical protein
MAGDLARVKVLLNATGTNQCENGSGEPDFFQFNSAVAIWSRTNLFTLAKFGIPIES